MNGVKHLTNSVCNPVVPENNGYHRSPETNTETNTDLSDIYFTPTEYLNLSIQIAEDTDIQGKVTSSGIRLEIKGLSGTNVASITVEKLPEGGAQYLLETLIFENSGYGRPYIPGMDLFEEEPVTTSDFLPAESVSKFLKYAELLGGKIFSEELGIFPKKIASSYSKIIYSVQNDHTDWEYFTNRSGEQGWTKLEGDLAANIRDDSTFVWIKAQTPLSTGRAHEDKLDFIIKNIISECDKSGNTELKEVLEEAWIKERGVSFDLRIINSIHGEHFKIDKSKLLVLAGKGFVMTVFDGDPKIKEEYYSNMQDPINDDQFTFLFNTLDFGIEKNESQIAKLYRRQAELQTELPYKNRDKSIDLAQVADNIEQLIDSARYIRDEAEDYIEAINDFPRKDLEEDKLNVINDCLDYARDVHETAQSLHEDCVELRNRVKEIREEVVNDLNVLTAVSTPLWTITTVAMVWRDFDAVSFAIIGALSLVTGAWYHHIKKRTSG